MIRATSTQIVPDDMIWLRHMKEPGDRLRELRLKKYATASEAARAFGWNENTYKSHENGERGIKLLMARRYAQAFGSDAAFILTGDKPGSIVQEVASIPLEGIVAAGEFRPSNWTPIEDEVGVPAVIRKGIPASRQYAVRVDGPSVNKRIADGMYAICAMFDSFPGGAAAGSLVHVVRERGGEVEHTIKELRVTANGVFLMPVSNDPDFQEPVKYHSDEDLTVRINGVVIGVFQPF